MILLTLENINEVSAGDHILYDGRGGIIEYDSAYQGGLKVGKRSLREIVKTCEKVYLLT